MQHSWVGCDSLALPVRFCSASVGFAPRAANTQTLDITHDCLQTARPLPALCALRQGTIQACTLALPYLRFFDSVASKGRQDCQKQSLIQLAATQLSHRPSPLQLSCIFPLFSFCRVVTFFVIQKVCLGCMPALQCICSPLQAATSI